MQKQKYRRPSVRRANLRSPSKSDLEGTVHYWWWRFLKASESYRRCCEANGSGRLSDLYMDFGDVRGDDFVAWSKGKHPSGDSRYAYLFFERVDAEETEGIVTVNSVSDWQQRFADDGYLLVAVNINIPSRAALVRHFKDWMNCESRSPNYMSDEDRQSLIERRRYYWTTTDDGKLVRKLRRDKQRPKADFPRKERSRGRRGRPNLANRGTARYRLERAYSTTALKQVFETYEAVEAAKQNDVFRSNQRREAVRIWRDLSRLAHYKLHRLRADDPFETKRVTKELSRLYAEAKECLSVLVDDDEKRLLNSREGIDALLIRFSEKRRNKDKTPYWKIGALLEERWASVGSDRTKQHSTPKPMRDIMELTKTVSRRYRRAKRLIAGTEKGLFPVG